MRMKTLTKKAADMNLKELASYIDYSVLKPEFTPEEIIDLTKDGVKLECATICINPGYMELCNPYVQGTNTMLCPFIGNFDKIPCEIKKPSGQDRNCGRGKICR